MVWSTLHALTFNLPDEISEAQYSVLRSLPVFLRQHLSCSLCRSHIKQHLIEVFYFNWGSSRGCKFPHCDHSAISSAEGRCDILILLSHLFVCLILRPSVCSPPTIIRGPTEYTKLGVPTSRRGVDWAFFFWRAHNYVNEQSEVTRCGSMDCQWGSWNSPAAASLCSGVYRYPWFLDWSAANTMWMQTPRGGATSGAAHQQDGRRTRPVLGASGADEK